MQMRDSNPQACENFELEMEELQSELENQQNELDMEMQEQTQEMLDQARQMSGGTGATESSKAEQVRT